MKEGKKSKIFIKAVAIVAAIPIALLWAAFVLLYLPPVQEFATRKISEAVAANSEFNLELGSVRLSFPFKLVVEDFILTTGNDTIASGEEVAASIRLLPLLRGEIEVNYISLENITADTHDLIEESRIKGNIGNFRTVARNINIITSEANIKQLHIKNAALSIEINGSDTPKEKTPTTNEWLIELQKANIENLQLAINIQRDTMQLTANVGKLSLKRVLADLAGNSYNIEQTEIDNSAVTYDKGTLPREEAPLEHLALNNITLHAGNISYSDTYAAEIEKFSFEQEGGINITHGFINVGGNSNRIDISRMLIKSENGTFMEGDATLPLAFAAKSNGKIEASLTTHIDKRDTRGFITTAQKEQLANLPDSLLNSHIEVSGTLADIKIDTAALSLPNIATLNIKGNIKEITDDKKREAAITLDGVLENLTPLFGKSQKNIVPLTINGEATAQGTILYSNIALAGKGEASVEMFYDTGNSSYAIKTDTRAFDLQASMPVIPLSALTLQAALSGQGTDIFDKATYYQLISNIDTINYNNTLLSDIVLSAYQANSLSLISLQSYNQAANLTLVANSRFDSLQSATSAELKIKNIDLAALGISEKPLGGAIDLKIDGSTNLQETHSLKLRGNGITIRTDNKNYTPAALNVDFATAPTGSHLNITNGDFLLASSVASGYRELAQTAEKLQTMIEDARTKEGVGCTVCDLERELPATDITLKCGNNNILASILAINGIKLANADVSCKLDTLQGLHINSTINDLSVAEFKTDSIRIKIGQQGENITYFADARRTAKNEKEKKQQFDATLYGNIEKDTLNTNISFTGNDNESRTTMGLTTLLEPTRLNIHLQPTALFMGTPITINSDNHITISKNSTISANLKATDRNNAGLHLYTLEDSTAKHDITLELTNIDLRTLTTTLPFAPNIAGTLSSDIHYRNDAEGEMFGCDIHGEGIAYEDYYIGNETAEIVYLPKKSGTHYLALQLHHNEEEVLSLHGDYDKEQEITGSTTITHLPLRLANAFMKESEITFDGYIDGELSLDGPITAPRSDGYIRFDSVHIDAPLLGSRLRLVDDKVEIKDSRTIFNNFNIYAKGETPFKINGDIDISNIATPVFNLRMQARNYTLVDAPRKKGSIVYGNLNVNFSSTIKGPINSLTMQGNATILGNSNVTYVVEESGISYNNEFEGLVEFVDFNNYSTTKPTKETPQLGNITINATLDIEEGAWINADLTPDRSNYVSLQGGGRLNMNYNNGEGITLTGRYTLNNGEMKYNIPIIPLKTFSISPGSYIYWTGDAFNPTLNITALERMVTPVDIEGFGSQPVAFDVGLVLSNSLDNMGLNFTMKAPENAVIQDELNSLTPETLNKYAVTMLVTGAYVGSKGGLTVSNALTSFLDAKINNIAGNAMKNVSINVGIADVENNQTGDSYMNYSFSFAKRFWNDRLSIIVGGEVNSGDHPENNQSFINNVSLEWKISNSGNRYLRIFYDKNYESILEGEITETGVGYIYKRKVNKFSELLYMKKRNKEPKK